MADTDRIYDESKKHFSACLQCSSGELKQGYMDDYIKCLKADRICQKWNWSDKDRPWWCPKEDKNGIQNEE